MKSQKVKIWYDSDLKSNPAPKSKSINWIQASSLIYIVIKQFFENYPEEKNYLRIKEISVQKDDKEVVKDIKDVYKKYNEQHPRITKH
jgi:hypothetical protein